MRHAHRCTVTHLLPPTGHRVKPVSSMVTFCAASVLFSAWMAAAIAYGSLAVPQSILKVMAAKSYSSNSMPSFRRPSLSQGPDSSPRAEATASMTTLAPARHVHHYVVKAGMLMAARQRIPP